MEQCDTLWTEPPEIDTYHTADCHCDIEETKFVWLHTATNVIPDCLCDMKRTKLSLVNSPTDGH